MAGMGGVGAFRMLIRIKASDEYSDKLAKAKAETKGLGDSTDEATKKTERFEKQAFKTNAMLGIMGATMVMNSLQTLGLIDRQSELGKTLNTVFGITQLLVGVTAIMNALHLKAIAHSISLAISKTGEAIAHWANAAGITAEQVALTVGVAAAGIVAGLAIGLGALSAHKAGWFQTSPGEFKTVPHDMLGVVHKGEVIGRPMGAGMGNVVFNIFGATDSFQTARQVTYELERLKRRGR